MKHPTAMNEKDVIDFGLELNRFLAERFKYSARFAKSRCDLWGNKVDIKTPKYRIVVSWKDYENTISITAISFTQTSAGHGTAVLSWLVGRSERYGYERIEFISVCSDKMKNFVRKFNFINHPQQKLFSDDDGWSKDWSNSVTNLRELIPAIDSPRIAGGN